MITDVVDSSAGMYHHPGYLPPGYAAPHGAYPYPYYMYGAPIPQHPQQQPSPASTGANCGDGQTPAGTAPALPPAAVSALANLPPGVLPQGVKVPGVPQQAPPNEENDDNKKETKKSSSCVIL